MEAFAALFATAGGSAAAGTAAAAAGSIAALGPAAGFAVPGAATLGAATAASYGAAGFGAAAAGAAGSSLLSFGANDILSGAFDTLSLVGDVLGTFSEIDQANQNAADRELQALTIRNQATLDEIRALEQLRADIGASVVNAYAGGVLPTGSVQAGIEEARKQQEFETTVGGRDARIRSAQLEREAESARGSVTSILWSGLSDAGGKLYGSYQRRQRRG